MSNTIPKFSILMPSIPSRLEKMCIPLLKKISDQSDGKPVEILTLIDNKKRSVGLKRDALVQTARGEYLAFVDDDDEISEDYVDSILLAIDNGNNADVIVFKQIAQINDGNEFEVDFSIEHINEDAEQFDGIWKNIKRQPFHVCVWKTEIAQKYRFPDASYGEDWHWCKRVLKDIKTEYRINKKLHFYRYRDNITEAALDFAEGSGPQELKKDIV